MHHNIFNCIQFFTYSMLTGKLEKILHLYGLYFSRLINYPLIKPNTITLTLTSKCNLRCIMCDHWRSKDIDELNTGEWKGIIDQIAEWGIREVDISGGEPFVRKEAFEIIEYLTQKNIGINITTNFTLLNKKDIEHLFETSTTRLQVSIDGIGKTHDEIRGKSGTFDKVMKNVEHFNTIKSKKKSKMQLNVTTVIMNKNLSKIVDLYNWAKENNFSSITYQPVVDSNLDIKRRDKINPLKIQIDHLPIMEKQIDKLINIRQKDFFIGNTVKHLKTIKKYFKNEPFPEVKCYAGFLVGIISPNGNMWSCMGDFANLRKQKVKEAWFSAAARRKRKLIKKCANPCLYPCYLETDADSIFEATLRIIK